MKFGKGKLIHKSKGFDKASSSHDKALGNVLKGKNIEGKKK